MVSRINYYTMNEKDDVPRKEADYGKDLFKKGKL